jgi:hypothetical protein
MHGYLSTGLCALQLPKNVVLSMARFRLRGHNLWIETGRHEGLLRNKRSCCRCKRLLGENFVAPIDDKEHLLFSCESTKDIRLRFAALHMSSLRNLMQCERESSLHVTNITYSGLQEHRIIVYTATGQKAKPKVHLSTESTVTGHSSKTPEACRRETEEHKLKTAV